MAQLNCMKIILLYIMASFYVLAGLNHFWNPEFYLKMMPPYLPWHETLNYISGAAEVLLGVLLFFPATRSFAAWGIIALLIAVLPANVYMYQARDTVFASIPVWLLIARLPFQLVFIAWAYLYT